MNRKEHLLVILAEECTEVGQRATKALRFGVNEIQPNHTKTNAERIKYEFNDLLAIIQMLQEENVLPEKIFDDEMIEKKKQQVKHYLEYSTQIGTLQE